MLRRGNGGYHWRLVVLVWLAFLLRGTFYCIQQPMWEGYDEWAHFAYVQHLAENRQIPAKTSLVPDVVWQSLTVVPLPYSLREWPLPHATHDVFWKLPAHEREEREKLLHQIGTEANASTPAVTVRALQYEAQQPPLYYIAMSLPYWMTAKLALPARVLVVRLASVLIASFVIPLGYLIAMQVLPVRRLALLVPILLAVLPALFIDVCRVGNESLAIVFSALLLFALLRSTRTRNTAFYWPAIGVILGGALLTKAYTLAFVPLLPLLALIHCIRRQSTRRRAVSGCALALTVAIVIAGWWYWRSWTTTGTLSGEQLDAIAASRFTVGQKIAALQTINWVTILDSGAFSHFWTGGWSFIVVRSWMYRVIELLALAAAVGLFILGWKMFARIWKTKILGRFSAQVLIVASSYLLLVMGLSYQTVVIFLTQNMTAFLGWYLYAVIAAEVVLFTIGMTAISRRHAAKCVAGAVILAIALDIYTVHFVLIPYYTGLISHRASGGLMAFHISDLVKTGLSEVLQRLSMNEAAFVSPAIVAGSWVAYLLATFSMAALAIALARSKPQVTKDS